MCQISKEHFIARWVRTKKCVEKLGRVCLHIHFDGNFQYQLNKANDQNFTEITSFEAPYTLAQWRLTINTWELTIAQLLTQPNSLRSLELTRHAKLISGRPRMNYSIKSSKCLSNKANGIYYYGRHMPHFCKFPWSIIPILPFITKTTNILSWAPYAE